jgi:hypothetical protein
MKMPARKQPKPDVQTPVTTETEEDHHRIKNWVTKEWLPIIGIQAYGLYGIYSSAANRELGNKWFFSIRTLEEFTFMGKSTINMNNWLLEACGLIRVNAGNETYANEYVVLPPPHVTPEILKPIIDMLKDDADMGKNWRAFKANALERIMKWKPLHECGKVSQFKKTQLSLKSEPISNTNGHHPALPSQSELVAALMDYFEPEKLTEAAAMKMIEQYGVATVWQQFDWLEYRGNTDSPLRTLRAALKSNWSEPKPVGKPEPKAWWDDGLHEVGEDGIVRPKARVNGQLTMDNGQLTIDN